MYKRIGRVLPHLPLKDQRATKGEQLKDPMGQTKNSHNPGQLIKPTSRVSYKSPQRGIKQEKKNPTNKPGHNRNRKSRSTAKPHSRQSVGISGGQSQVGTLGFFLI